MDLRLELSCDRSMLAVRGICILIRKVLSELLTPQSLSSVEIAAAELCTNAVKHGSRPGEMSPLNVRLELTGDDVRVHLIDQGTPFDPSNFERPRVDRNDRDSLPTAGMGLSLIHDTMDEVEFRSEDDVHTVILVKRVRRKRDTLAQPPTDLAIANGG